MKRSESRRRLVGMVTAGLVAIGLLTAPAIVDTPPASAAVASQFDPGNIISNDTFYNGLAMDASQIQSFLNSKVSSCSGSNGEPCLKDYRQSTATRAATSYCSQYTGASNESAAQIIQKVGAACSINPQVLIVMLEKEEGLVTSTAPTSGRYQIAMGYACPDTAPCDAQYYGFFNQVYSAASQFQRYTKSSSSWSYQPGRNNNILYNPNAACGTKSVYIANQATANLYIYTPYTPNAAALNNLYGTGDSCSSYGNRNFWVDFTDWFGNPAGLLQSPSFEGGTSTGWGESNGFVNQMVYKNPSLAQDGSWYLATNTPVAGRAMTQDIQRSINIGEQATVSVWLRSATATPFSGVMAVWGLGGTTESQTSAFTVTNTWKQFTVKLPIRKSSHSTIRLDIYMTTTLNVGTLLVDNAAASIGAAPPAENLLANSSFEGTFAGWGPTNGFINQQIYQDPRYVHSGKWFAAANTPVSGRSFATDTAVSGTKNDRFTFSVWLRSSDPTKTFTGVVALWGLGGSSNIVATTPYSVSGQYQKITVTLDVTIANITDLRGEIYMGSTNQTLFLDTAQLSKNILAAGSFEGGAFTNWGAGNGVINQAVYGSTAATPSKDGSYFAATNTATTGSSLAQTVQRETTIGDNFTAEVWVRSATPGVKFNGRLALWAFGGTTEVASQSFSVDSTWTLVQLPLPIAQDGHTSLKFELYLDTTGTTLFLDGAQVY